MRVREGMVGVVQRRGRPRLLPPGRHWLVPGLDRYVGVVDAGPQVRQVPVFTAVDRDGATVSLGLRLAWTVKDPVAAVTEIVRVAEGVEQLAVVSARNHVGAVGVEEVLVGSGALAEGVREVLAEACQRWGVAVDRIEVTHLTRGHG
ncbi:SPFH domain-containing protein [Nocardioides sp. CFH 31398]|uniref:SPFH domain-containing protein n=1 Tax=Nocardioides sp. CFH 31398 TaxID=2919579 RepID=UPI001F06835B|nr:SPFH domain-containing protein [Nocardioides sp. CFH 31398]MCH1866786.1 SPFH domain-containing protein [Nocardioides sp. CFH 31398]